MCEGKVLMDIRVANLSFSYFSYTVQNQSIVHNVVANLFFHLFFLHNSKSADHAFNSCQFVFFIYFS